MDMLSELKGSIYWHYISDKNNKIISYMVLWGDFINLRYLNLFIKI